MNLKTSKTLGGIGAILLVVGGLPYISQLGIIGFIGALLVLVGLYGFARAYKERGIFNNALYGILAGIIGVVLATVIGIAVVLPNITDFLLKVFPSWNGDWTTITSLSGMIPNTSNIEFGDIIPFITAAILVIATLWVFAIIATFFIRRSLVQLSAKTNVRLISTAGTLLLIGAVLIFLFGLGLLLMWIGVLILAIAFFKIRIEETAT
jgi:uncharacterized membrane protein